MVVLFLDCKYGFWDPGPALQLNLMGSNLWSETQVGYVFLIVSMLFHAAIRRYDHREGAPHFIWN